MPAGEVMNKNMNYTHLVKPRVEPGGVATMTLADKCFESMCSQGVTSTTEIISKKASHSATRKMCSGSSLEAGTRSQTFSVRPFVFGYKTCRLTDTRLLLFKVPIHLATILFLATADATKAGRVEAGQGAHSWGALSVFLPLVLASHLSIQVRNQHEKRNGIRAQLSFF